MAQWNKRVTLILAVLAAVFWMQGWWNGARPGGAIFGSSQMSNIGYPRSMAIALTFATCLGWTFMVLNDVFGIHEARCRKCRYILRGLSEPRCPECGESI